METNTETQNSEEVVVEDAQRRKKGFNWRFFAIDIPIMAIMCVLLYYGASWQIFRVHTDAAHYECYAQAFWHGLPVLRNYSPDQCGFITDPATKTITNDQIVSTMQRLHFPGRVVRFVSSQSPNKPFHALPLEYPMLALIPFSLGLVAPSHLWYQVAFAGWMGLVAVGIYLLLLRYRSRGAAIACALYLVAGNWGTAAGRFDLVPAALSIVAVILGMRKHWNWAFSFLALATMCKFYPAVLLIPFLIGQQLSTQGRWYAWRRALPLVIFIATCAVITFVSLLLSVRGTLAPLGYFQNRPFQIESTWASLLWLLSPLGYPLTAVHTFGSLNVLSPLSSLFSPISTGLLVAGLLYMYWLHARGKITLAMSCMLTLLIVIFTGKVFSPQYLIWVSPIIAYVGEADPRWVVPWTTLGLLTTWIYPYLYNQTHEIMDVPKVPLFYPVVAVRNGLMLVFVSALLVMCSLRKGGHGKERAPTQGRSKAVRLGEVS